MRKLVAALSVAGLGLSTFAIVAPSTGAAPTQTASVSEARPSDDLPNPLEQKRRALRQTALEQVIGGTATTERRNGSTVVKVGTTNGTATKDQYVELSNERTDRIFTLLVEFGDMRHPRYPDEDTDPAVQGPSTFEGPLHNAIPEPDRSVDNTTIWQPDFSADSFRELYFGTHGETLKTFYERQSSGRYSVDGTVTDWVKVRFNEARYGRSNGFPCADIVCDNTWVLIKDGMNQWVADQTAAGLSKDEIAAELATFDVYDRYDFDGDGDFNEPDGYVDHLQVIHSGGDQADGDKIQGEDAIWSHRWYAYVSDVGLTGPPANPLGGTAVGTTGLWAGDYTIQAENGGLSTVAHEFGHDLGLPDHYDTAGGDNGVEWWTLMAQSRLSGKGEPIGTRAGDLSAWDKLQLGWLDYVATEAGSTKTIDLGPHEYNSAKPQAAIVILPEKEVTAEYGDPFAGERMWWSTKGDNIDTSMTQAVDLTGATSAAIDMKARYDIEAGFDYLYVRASDDGGATWTALDGTVDGAPFGTDGSGTPSIDGNSGGAWVDVHVPLDAYAGAPVEVQLEYRTDGGVAPDGYFADDIVVSADGTAVLESGAESGDEGWTLDGFMSTTGTETGVFPNYYIASNRSFVSYDKYLKTGPYNFGFVSTRPDWVEHFSYEPGLLISYWDTSQLDNNTSEHPGAGLILPIDSRPTALIRPDGAPWRSRVQVHDAPFSLNAGGAFNLHLDGAISPIPGLPGQPLFDDSNSYQDPALPLTGVDVPDTGTRIKVLTMNGTSMTIRVSPG